MESYKNLWRWMFVPMAIMLLALTVIIVLTFLAAYKYKNLKNPATWLAVGINVYAYFLEPLDKSDIGNLL